MPSRPSTAPSKAPDIVAGSDAWIGVAVATGWHAPDPPRDADAEALANPPQIRAWLAALTQSQQAALIGLMDTQMLLGERVHVVSVTNGWARVVVPDQPTPLDARGYPVWVPLVQLAAVSPPNAESHASVVTPTAWLRSESGQPITEISFATQLPVLRSDGAHLEVGLPGRGSAWLDASDVVVGGAGLAHLPATGTSIVESARAFVGLRYLWSGTSGFGVDCSGLVHLVYREHGITLPRDADAQALAGAPITRRALQPGDLVFFARSGVVHHVAIYAGDGQLIDAPDVAKPVRTYALAAVSSAEDLSYRRVLPAGQP
jgi:cell wall-associated NlpC family hydrolase